MEGMSVVPWYFNGLHLKLAIKTKFLVRLKFQSETEHQMSGGCTKLQFVWAETPEWCECSNEFRSGSFLVFIPAPTETGGHPRGYRGGGCGGVTQMFTRGVSPHNPPLQLQATYTYSQLSKKNTDNLPCNHTKLWPTWMWVSETGLWLEATRRGEAFPDLVSPAGIPANRHGQTVISHLKAWKNGDHFTRKHQDFWTFNLPPLLYSATITTAVR